MRSNEPLHAMALEQAPEAVLITTVDLQAPGPTIVALNFAFTRLTGYLPEEVAGQPVQVLGGEHTQPTMLDMLPEILQSGQARSWRAIHYRKGGEEVLLEVSAAPLRDESGSIAYLTALLRDVTAQSRLENALRQNERLLQHISDALPAVLYIYDMESGSLRYVSRESLAILGRLPGELTGGEMMLEQLLYPDDLPHVRQEMERLKHAREGAMVEAECRARHRTGEWKWLMLRTIVFDRFPDGSARQLLGVAIDVTESRRLREQLSQSSKMEGLGRLAGGVAHDFNNLLTIIQSYTEMAQESLPEEHPVQAYLQHILHASEQASNLTIQMLTFARRRIISPKVVNVNDLVREAEALLQRVLPENVRLVTTLEPDLWQVYADPTQVEQVILNLALNARDAMPEGGALTIETANMTLDDSYTSRHIEVRTGEYVLLAVSDTGIGMDEHTLARVFEPFFTTKDVGKGTGLGLATCYGIVRQAGGHIWVYSEPGKGTTFKVYLPRTHEASVSSSGHAVQKKAVGGAETILVVEDNDDVRRVAVAVLEMHGYRVLQAGNGEEALALMDNLTEKVHLLLTDVVMPGMSGPTLALQLRERYPHLKVLYTSGYTENVIVHHGVLNEGIAFLSKPYRPADLTQRVREVLDSP